MKTVALSAGCALLLSAGSPGAAFAAYVGAAPLIVANGGTGATTLTAHGVLLGQGAGAITAIAPGTTGIPLIGQGGTSDPIYGTATVAGGGTGLATLTAHSLMVGEGTSNVALVVPSATSGIGLVSTGSSTDPAYGTTVVAGGGTGATTLAAHGLLVGEGTSPVIALTPAADSIALWQSATADPTITPINNCTTAGSSALTYATATHTFGCNSIAGGGGVALTTSIVTGASPITVAATNGLTTIVSMATPGVSTITLPTAVVTAGWRECIKDGTTNFGTFNATIKSTAGSIDGVAAGTGVVMNQTHQELCFISDGANWNIE